MADKKAQMTEGEVDKSGRRRWASLVILAASLLAVSVAGWVIGQGWFVGVMWLAVIICIVIVAPLAALSSFIQRIREEDPAETTAQGKPYPKWKLWLRRATRPKPFWRQHMDEQLSDDYGVQPDAEFSFSLDLGAPVANGLLFISFAGIFIALLVQFVIGPIFLSPGFWQFGPAYPIALFLANVCRATGQCDFHYLIGGLAVSLIVLTAIVEAVVLPMSDGRSGVEVEREALASERSANLSADIAEAVGVLDGRFVRLRADLVMAGILPLSLEEQEEAADAIIAAGPPLPPDGDDVAPAETTAPAPAAPLTYQRPEVTEASKQAAAHLALDLTANKSTPDIRKALAAFALENERLIREVNDHRQARGLAPLPAVRY